MWTMRYVLAVTAMTVALVLGMAAAGGAADSVAHAESTTTAVRVVRDIEYGVAGGYSLRLDAILPDGQGPHPALLVVHGGGWRSGDKRQFGRPAQMLAEAGFAVFSANYRLAPPGGEWHYPAPVDDLRMAMLWIRAHAAEYGADATRVGALGGSAGGNLVLMLGTSGEPGRDRADAVVSWSGPTDFRTLGGARGDAIAANYIGCTLAACPEIWDAASPLSHVDAGSAPSYIVNSDMELTPLQQATDMAAALERAGVPVTLRVLPGNRHSQTFAADVMDETAMFLRTYLTASR
jgi:acetyl esterase